jgi:hypothetical protein
LKQSVKARAKKHLSFHALRQAMFEHCKARDPRQVGKCSYSQHDIMMSTLSATTNTYYWHNLQSLFDVSNISQESQKQNCEYKSAKRFIQRLKHIRTRLGLLLCGTECSPASP